MTHPLPSWHDTPTRDAITAFVASVCRQGDPSFVPAPERIAVFDNDGTLWCEKPMQPEVGFLLERLAAMAEHDATLRSRQPWKAAHERDYAWLSSAITKHYQGDETDVQVLLAGVVQAYAGWTVEAAPAAPAEPEQPPYMAELEQLNELKTQGNVSEEEFEAKKKLILGV
jgi:hypothetical protein